ncbi:MAG: hypothetical protein IM653_01900 [Phenylobacterium sp.]|uniref:YccF domain-containing protein n=1 Tax=Phenylobacterium sp. TaxID=1871053 RepID=UPI0025F32256|nr:YccF domain-containing protein [Phenylobacterium sp.]MCA6225104.1 hypothetical protein [Phenylobacterium sp.]MCA6226987.1 hypothetical protein [Phenylobacterium sp.]MCA6232762.1 hypothetical protein [Phenylobacterium sp.]MCA6233868.1 hypothetical protein [Phenylobacterium sp.]MCA6249156.1 hypothetical protein [Phenylobacterium sp.]
MNLVLNILWFVLGGFIAGTLWMVAGLLLLVTVVGAPWAFAAFRIGRFSYAPFGLQHLKLAIISLAPVGTEIVRT